MHLVTNPAYHMEPMIYISHQVATPPLYIFDLVNSKIR